MNRRRKSRKSSHFNSLYLFLILFCFLGLGLKHFYPEQVANVTNLLVDKISQEVDQNFTDEFARKIKAYVGIPPQSSISEVGRKPSAAKTENAGDVEILADSFLPACPQKVQILNNIGYISGFSNELGIPLWVGYVATYPFKYQTSKRPSSFIRDSRASGCPEHKDYSDSGYDRGHMAPNYVIGRCYGQTAQMQTFYLTNIVPQKANMNRGVWCDIEQYIANNLAQKYGKVLVFVGPIIDSSSSKIKGRIAIPKACFAVIMVKSGAGEIFAIGFIVPQAPAKKSIWDYCVSIDKIESLTGIDFLPQLNDEIENIVEANTNIVPFK